MFNIVKALKQLAAAHDRSAGAVRRKILKMVLRRPKRRSFKELLASMPNVGNDEDFNLRLQTECGQRPDHATHSKFHWHKT
jgi:plasmid stability protein